MKSLTVLLILAIAGAASAATAGDYSDLPGYVDLSDMQDFKVEGEEVEVYITKPMLNMMSAVVAGEDQELGQFMEALNLIRVEQFEIGRETAGVIRKAIEQKGEKLAEQGWEKMVRVKEEDEIVEVYIKPVDEKIEGLCVMVQDSSEVVFVNIVGTIDMSLLGKLSGQFNIPAVNNFVPAGNAPDAPQEDEPEASEPASEE